MKFDYNRYAIAGSEGEWQEIATATSVPNVVSIKRSKDFFGSEYELEGAFPFRRGQKRDKGKDVQGIDEQPASAKKPKKKKKQRS